MNLVPSFGDVAHQPDKETKHSRAEANGLSHMYIHVRRDDGQMMGRPQFRLDRSIGRGASRGK